MNSYQRLKKKNDKLREEYRELFQKFYQYLKDPDSLESIKVAFDIRTRGDLAKMFMYGDRNGLNAIGLLEKIANTKLSDSTFSWNIMDRRRDE